MRILLLSLLLPVLALAQAPAPAPAPDGSTVVTSDLFRLDQTKHEGVFTGNVLVTSKDFRMTTRELTVYFATATEKAGAGGQPASKVERLVARGDVQIQAGPRTATGAQADYTLADDKMVLTGNPQVTQNHDTITGTTITLYRTANRMEVDGRSRVVLTGMDGAAAPKKTPASQDNSND
ncbi:MAG: LptA/OstA family protein [Verrucomicrobium sp.]|nr:LptA/OstA family protein [Verrucomicrobium sp.]